MAEKIVSPGVFTTEVDESFLPAAIEDIGAAIVGPTVKGPAMIPTVVSSYSEYQDRFGGSFKSGSSYYRYFTDHAAEEYLKSGNALTVMRIMDGSFSAASATISSSIDPDVIGTQGAKRAHGRVTLQGTGAEGLVLTGSLVVDGVTFTFVDDGVDYSAGDSTTALNVPTGSSLAASATSLVKVINDSGSLGSSGTPHIARISASAASNVVTLYFNKPGNFGTNAAKTNRQGSSFINSGSMASITTGSIDGGIRLTEQWNHGADAYSGSYKTPFKLHTLSHGDIQNSLGSHTTGDYSWAEYGNQSLSDSGSKHNLRWEIGSVNFDKGTFTLLVRRGDDTEKRKQILETWNDLNLDENSSNYISKRIGDQYLSLNGSGTNDPYLSINGTYPNKSKYVRVEVLESTTDYLDENGNVRVPAYSASLPAFHSGSNSGSQAGLFSGGGDGTVSTHPHNFYENSTTRANTQGLNLTAGTSGDTAYLDALNLLKNQDEYDINLLLVPGLYDDTHTNIITKAIDVCEARGDCFVIADPAGYGKQPVDVTTRAETRDSSYSAMYYPWVQIPDNQTGNPRWVPPSVVMGGIYSLNDSIAHPWFAPAGLNRGTISTAITTERKILQGERDDLYESNINPIASFPGQGVTVWGQKTLQKKESALDRVNVRRLLIKLKKFIASSSRFLVFEQNNSSTRNKFLNIVNPYMEQVQQQSGLTAFRVVMDETNNTPDSIDRNQLVGQIFVQPTKTAEFIVLDFSLLPTGASFPE